MSPLKLSRVRHYVETLARVGPISAGEFGWKLWGGDGPTTGGGGSAQANKYCRSAGKILADLERRGLARSDRPNGVVKLWSTTGKAIR